MSATTAQSGEAATNRLSIRWPASAMQPWVSVNAADDTVTILETTPDLRGWTELLRGHGALADVPDLSAVDARQRFYRSVHRERTGLDDWKNLLQAHADPFQSPAPPPDKHESRWVKFAILFNAPHRAVFQDSTKYPFHYDFAASRLPEFRGLTRAQFDAATLHTNGQRAVLGAVLFPPTTNLVEAGLQFVGMDAYPCEAVAGWFDTVRPMLGLAPSTPVFYLPTFEQRDMAAVNASWFAERGIAVSSADRWVIADEIYAAGWALGRLVLVPGKEIDDAYRDGRLRHDDILLTDAVPADVPPIAGIVTLSPATPNSHVALLAKSFGIPFVYIVQPGFAERVMSLVGRDVLVRAIDYFSERQALVVPVASVLPPALRAEIMALKIPPKLNLTSKSHAGYLSVAADALSPRDIRIVGGKAANFGILRRSVPDNSPAPAIAFTFDLWDAYLDQRLPDQRTLREAIAGRLGGFTWPPEMSALQTALAQVRELVADTADFSPAQRTAIIAALQAAGFDTHRNIRFRSSTNVEDSEQFSGAGLYDSFSGCLADDLDADASGPSRCDPGEPRERGVFRALRKVFASFYNYNAYLERLRHAVNETNAGMALLVHHSTPDELEMANGVAVLEIENHQGATWQIRSRLISQAGAVSVTNPDTAARPEEVRVVEFSSGGLYPSVVSRSSLVALGDTVLTWEQDYRQLQGLLKAAAFRWQSEVGTNAFATLDFEYKKEQPGRLSVKQIRTVPPPSPVARVTPYLISTTNRYALIQGETGDVIANHRLKSLWGLTTRHAQFAKSNFTSTILTTLDTEWRQGTNAVRVSGPPATLPEYQFTREADHTLDRWVLGAGAERREFELRVFDVPAYVHWLGPLQLLDDHRIELTAIHATAQPTLTYEDFAITNTFIERVTIGPVVPVGPRSVRQSRLLTHRHVSVATSYYWPRDVGQAGAGYTAPVIAWAGTTITGLTTRPIVLSGEFSQTYRPGHHNIWEDYAFDPWLEPGIDADLLDELARANVRALVVRRGRPATPLSASADGKDADEPPSAAAEPATEPGEEAVFFLWGLDGTLRPAR